jgi:hypothetical protein
VTLSSSAAVAALSLQALLSLYPQFDTSRIDLSARLPAALLRTLKPFQQDGVRFCVARGGCALLADEMGCGKTVQAIAVATYFRDQWPLLVIAPNTLILNWQDELSKFGGLEPGRVHKIETGKSKLPDAVAAVISSRRRKPAGAAAAATAASSVAAVPLDSRHVVLISFVPARVRHPQPPLSR